VTARGDLDPGAAFFTAGDTEKIVYSTDAVAPSLSAALGAAATVVPAGSPLTMATVLADLASRGVGRLMVEGGSTVLTGLLATGLFDELHLVVAPFFVGDSRAPRFVGDAGFPFRADHRLRLLDQAAVGDCVLLRYANPEATP